MIIFNSTPPQPTIGVEIFKGAILSMTINSLSVASQHSKHL